MSEKELHTHGTDCACGHNHHHHDDGCGCGHDHAHEDIDKKAFLRKFVPGLFFFLLGAAVEHLIPGSEPCGIMLSWQPLPCRIFLWVSPFCARRWRVCWPKTFLTKIC